MESIIVVLNQKPLATDRHSNSKQYGWALGLITLYYAKVVWQPWAILRMVL